jgi:hypothetical protein
MTNRKRLTASLHPGAEQLITVTNRKRLTASLHPRAEQLITLTNRKRLTASLHPRAEQLITLTNRKRLTASLHPGAEQLMIKGLRLSPLVVILLMLFLQPLFWKPLFWKPLFRLVVGKPLQPAGRAGTAGGGSGTVAHACTPRLSLAKISATARDRGFIPKTAKSGILLCFLLDISLRKKKPVSRTNLILQYIN